MTEVNDAEHPTVPSHVRLELVHAYMQIVADACGADILHVKGAAIHPELSDGRRGSLDVDILVRPDHVDLLLAEMQDRYGEPPQEVASLLLVARFRARAREAGIGEVTIAGRNVRFAPVDLPESRVLRLQRLYPKSIVKPQLDTVLVPRPQTAKVGGRPLDGIALLEWARQVIDSVIDPRESTA